MTRPLRTVARRLGLRTVLSRGTRALGFDAVRRDYYSPVPDWRNLPPETWTTPSVMHEIGFDVDAQLRQLERIAPWVAEFSPPVERPRGPAQFFYRNSFFQALDADVLYAMVRELKPARVLELGSGFSSLAIGTAAVRNRADGAPIRHDVYDPFAREDLQGALRAAANLHLVSATDVPLEAFSSLQAGDILFVDTTHTVKLASDVNFVVFEVLPLLRPGVVVHFHDIFLPWEYPREWLMEHEVYWAEQYLLQAFLMHNDAWEVLLAVHALLRAHPERVAALVPSLEHAMNPGSFWMRRVR